MKRNKFSILSFLTGIAFLTAVGFLNLALVSCSDDLGVNTPEEDAPDGIVLRIPDLKDAMTRAGVDESDPTAAEGVLDNLWLVVFESGNTEPKICTDISEESQISGTLNSTYKEYKLNLSPGTYKFYLLGNLNSYVSDLSDKIKTESGIESLVLSFNGRITGNLPMACLADEISLTADGDGVTNGEVEITPQDVANGKAIYANLKFLCSKVRYTVLFDNSDENVSKSFGEKVADFTSVNFSKVLKQTPISGTQSYLDDNATTSTGILTKYVYPGADYPQNSSAANLTGVAWQNSDNKRAWQGVAYLPENVSATKTMFSLAGACYASTASDAKKIFDIDYNTELFPANMADEKLTRGKMYDLVIKVKNNSSLETAVTIGNWDYQSLIFGLHGPYELEVEKTEVGVKSGAITKFAYSSDVAVTCESPKLDNSDLAEGSFTTTGAGQPLFIFNIETDSIAVEINNDIPYDDLTKIIRGGIKDKYNYFHVNAGSLRKKINCNPLDLNPYFTVKPMKVTVDLREYITSGQYSVSLPIEFETNINEKTIALTDNFNLCTNADGANGAYLKLDVPSGVLSEMKGTLNLEINGMNSGNDFWKTKHTFTFDLTIEFPAGTTDPEGTNGKRTVTIEVLPYSTDYVIHFKVNRTDITWNMPHIYVYQCLEMPGADATYPGKTVGYLDTGDNGYRAYNAGLEYAFTTDISFKGWSGYGGSVNPGNANGYTNGFVLFNSYNFNPTAGSTNIYNYGIDLNTAHKASGHYADYCEECNETRYRKLDDKIRTWPGIAMEYEGNGWWKYTLSGVATPGKAMIMFTEGHTDGQANGYRYPANAEVGVPLFDFPNNEGWFVFNGDTHDRNQNFENTQPVTQTVSEPVKQKAYRLYWPKSKGDHIYIASGNTQIPKDQWRSGTTTYFNYIDFYTSLTGNLNYNYSYPEGTIKSTINLGSFNDNGNGKYCAYLGTTSSATQLTGGVPGSSVNPQNRNNFQQDDLLRIQWYHEYGGAEQYDLWMDKVENGGWVDLGYGGDLDSNGYRYLNYRVESAFGTWWTINFQLGNNVGHSGPYKSMTFTEIRNKMMNNEYLPMW